MLKLLSAFREHRAGNSEMGSLRKHCPECQAIRDNVETHRKIYHKAWPKACPNCNGYGGWEEPEADPDDYFGFIACPECMGQGKCPRCNTQVFNNGEDFSVYMICPACGWDEHAPAGCPEQAICICDDGLGLTQEIRDD